MIKVTCKINIVHYSCNLSSLSVNLVCCIISLRSPLSIIRVCMPLWHSLVRYYVSFRSIIQWINLILFVCFSYAVKFSSAHIKASLSVSDYSFVSYDTVFLATFQIEDVPIFYFWELFIVLVNTTIRTERKECPFYI